MEKIKRILRLFWSSIKQVIGVSILLVSPLTIMFVIGGIAVALANTVGGFLSFVIVFIGAMLSAAFLITIHKYFYGEM